MSPHLDIHAGGQVQGHEAVDGGGGQVLHVNQPLVQAHLGQEAGAEQRGWARRPWRTTTAGWKDRRPTCKGAPTHRCDQHPTSTDDTREARRGPPQTARGSPCSRGASAAQCTPSCCSRGAGGAGPATHERGGGVGSGRRTAAAARIVAQPAHSVSCSDEACQCMRQHAVAARHCSEHGARLVASAGGGTHGDTNCACCTSTPCFVQPMPPAGH